MEHKLTKSKEQTSGERCSTINCGTRVKEWANTIPEKANIGFWGFGDKIRLVCQTVILWGLSDQACVGWGGK